MAPLGETTLYSHRFSPFAQRVHVAMVAKDIPFNAVLVDFADKPQGLIDANPIYGKVPTLVQDGKSVCESLIILEFLEEAWPETTPLMPKDPLGKAKSRFWADYMYKGFGNMQKIPSMPDGPEREAMKAELPKFFKTIEETITAYSAEGPFFTGDKLSYLDIILLPLASWQKLLEKMLQQPIPGPDQLPRVHKCLNAIREHKAYKEVIASEEVHADFFSKMMARRAAAAEAAKAAAAKAANGN